MSYLIRRVLAKPRLILDEMCRLYGKIEAYLRRVLCKTRLIFPRINGPSMYIIHTIPHGKCFIRYLRTRCFCIRNLTRSLRSLVRFLIRQQLVRKYRTPALSMKYSLYVIRRIHTVKTMAISRLTFVSSVLRTSATSLLISHQSARSRK